MKHGAAPRTISHLAAALLMAIGTVALSAAQDKEAGKVKGQVLVTRQDLAELIQTVDQLYADGKRLPAKGELSAEAATQQAFDALSMDFLRLRMGTAFAKLDALRVALGGGDERFVDEVRLEVQVEDQWVRRATYTDAIAPSDGIHTFRIRSVRPFEELHDSSVPFEFWESWKGPKGSSFAFATDDRGAVAPKEFRAAFNPLRAARVGEPAIVFRDQVERTRLRIEYVKGDATPAEMRAEWLARLAKLTEVEPDAARVFAARAALRWEAPSQKRSSEFLTDGIRHAHAVEGELEALEAGRDPYRHRSGDSWRTHSHEDRDLPMRVYAPESLADAPVPLVVAFHGAGGDESFFFELAGNGRIKALADVHGCLVVAPFTPHYVANADAFDSLVASVAADYPVDQEQIYLIGHSLGAMTVARLVAKRGERIRAAACVAGFRAVTKEAPPVLVIQGARDPIIPAKRVAESVRASEDADVDYVVLEDMGHTLLLQRAVELAFARWFE